MSQSTETRRSVGRIYKTFNIEMKFREMFFGLAAGLTLGDLPLIKVVYSHGQLNQNVTFISFCNAAMT